MQSKTLKFRQRKWPFNFGCPFPLSCLNKFSGIVTYNAVPSGIKLAGNQSPRYFLNAVRTTRSPETFFVEPL